LIETKKITCLNKSVYLFRFSVNVSPKLQVGNLYRIAYDIYLKSKKLTFESFERNLNRYILCIPINNWNFYTVFERNNERRLFLSVLNQYKSDVSETFDRIYAQQTEAKIYMLLPKKGKSGDFISIHGEGFKDIHVCKFGIHKAAKVKYSANAIFCRIPHEIEEQMVRVGIYDDDKLVSNEEDFIISTPTITYLQQVLIQLQQ